MKEPRGEQNLKFKNGKWYLDFTFRGKRYRLFGGYTKEQAKNTLAKFRIELLDKKFGFKKSNTGEPILFERHADEVLELHSKKNKRSWARDELSLAGLKRFFKGQMIQDIGPADVERFKAQRSGEFKRNVGPKKKIPISPATVNRELAFLKTVFNKAVEWGRLENNPAARVKKFRENNVKERILNDDEARRLIGISSPALRPIIIIALNTGMRRGEILGLRWEDIDFNKGFIGIQAGESKTGEGRKIPMNYQVFEVLKSIPRSPEHVFFNPETKDHIKDIKTGFKSACQRAGIKGLRFHDLRHTGASRMVEAGVDLATVSKILGHSSIQMTMRYTHPTPENMKRAVEKLAEIYGETRHKVDTIQIPKPVSHSKVYN